MTIIPLKDSFFFSFCSDHSQGRFIEKNSGSIILTDQDFDSQGKYARWGKVEYVGPLVKDFKVGDFVLIEALKWTKKFEIDHKSYWKSDASKVIAIADDEESTFAY